jgi:hypothetical protein
VPAGRKGNKARHPAEVLGYYRDLIDEQMSEVGEKLALVDGWKLFSISQKMVLYARVDTSTHVAAAEGLGFSREWLYKSTKNSANFKEALQVAKGLGEHHTVQWPAEILVRDATHFLMRVMSGSQPGAKKGSVSMADRIRAAGMLRATPLEKKSGSLGGKEEPLSPNGVEAGAGSLDFGFGPER